MLSCLILSIYNDIHLFNLFLKYLLRSEKGTISISRPYPRQGKQSLNSVKLLISYPDQLYDSFSTL